MAEPTPEDEAIAEAMRAMAQLIGHVAPEAEQKGVGILVRLGHGCIAAEPSPGIPEGEIEYVFSDDLGDLIVGPDDD